MKISTHKISAYGMWVDRWWAWPKRSWQRGQLFSSNSRYCHPADGVFDANIFLFVPVSLQMRANDKENSERDRVYVSITSLFAQHRAPRPWTGLLSQKLVLRAFSDFPQKLLPQKLPITQYYMYTCIIDNVESVHTFPQKRNPFLRYYFCWCFWYTSSNDRQGIIVRSSLSEHSLGWLEKHLNSRDNNIIIN